MDKNKDITYKNLQDGAKAVFRQKFTDVTIQIKKEERSQINNNLTIEKKEKETKSKASRKNNNNKTWNRIK